MCVVEASVPHYVPGCGAKGKLSEDDEVLEHLSRTRTLTKLADIEAWPIGSVAHVVKSSNFNRAHQEVGEICALIDFDQAIHRLYRVLLLGQ